MVNPTDSKTIKLQLSRDLVKVIKRGHAWVYADALRGLPKAPPGTPAILRDNRGGRPIAQGFYDPSNPIAFRVCTTNPDQRPDAKWAERQMTKALALRKTLKLSQNSTNAYRLFNGEGDGLPGLVCDIYNEYAVISTDGLGADHFWNPHEIAAWLNQHLDIQSVILKKRTADGKLTSSIFGSTPQEPVPFLENNISFTADLVEGQKTGFYLDQRDNRARIRKITEGKTVLNVFGYTGGFSVYAGLGGAINVTTVDQAAPALESADLHWQMNGLAPESHSTACEDAFDYLKTCQNQNDSWDIVILDPPSFAPSEAALPQARKAYTRLIELGVRATKSGGLLAAASCSSHVDSNLFLEIIEQSISQARRKATILGIHGQPPDHPAPLVMPELRYLKFVLIKLD
jgi:23S rRNA (cytosine1962-C5)-methyltransferase